MDAKTQTSDPQLERDQIPKVKADQQILDANNRRERLRRSIYFGSETEQQREIRLTKQRERSRKNRAVKTEREKVLVRKESNRKKQEKRAQETSNQKFWRLIRRRQHRKRGYNLSSIEFEYHRSTNKYGIDIDSAPSHDVVVELSDVGMKLMISIFNDMLNLVHTGKTIPMNKFMIFDHYGIYLPQSFFKEYLEDLASISEIDE